MSSAEGLPLIIKPHHVLYAFGALHQLYLLKDLPEEKQRQRIARRSQLWLDDPSSSYTDFGGPSDLIGNTSQERTAYEERKFQLICQLASLPDDYPIVIRVDANDIICTLNVRGDHCKAYRRDKNRVAAENEDALYLLTEIKNAGGVAERRDPKKGNIISVITNWGSIKGYWQYTNTTHFGNVMKAWLQELEKLESEI